MMRHWLLGILLVLGSLQFPVLGVCAEKPEAFERGPLTLQIKVPLASSAEQILTSVMAQLQQRYALLAPVQVKLTTSHFQTGMAPLPGLQYLSGVQMVRSSEVESSLISITRLSAVSVSVWFRFFPNLEAALPLDAVAPPENFALNAVAQNTVGRDPLKKISVAKRVRFFNDGWKIGTEVSVAGIADTSFVQVDGTIKAIDRRIFDVSGNVMGRGVLFDPAAVGNNLQALPLGSLRVGLSTGSIGFSNAFGDFLLPLNQSSAQLTASVAAGAFVDVQNQQGATLQLNQTVQNATDVAVLLNPSGNVEFDTAQINAYFHTQGVRDWVISQGLNHPGLNLPLQVNVNLGSSALTCNAFYQAGGLPSLNFAQSGSFPGNACRNAAYDTIIHHEFGHFLDDLYGGITNLGLSEGWGDIVTTFLTGQPLEGENFFLPGSMFGPHLRSADNTVEYPPNPGGLDQHLLGQSWAGFAWDTRQNLIQSFGSQWGVLAANYLFLPLMAANSPNIPAAVHDLLLRADDDGNLANGTLAYFEIARAASRHNLSFVLPIKPEIFAVSASFVEPGGWIQLTGVNFNLGGAPTARLGNQPLLTRNATATSVEVQIPNGARSGWVGVESAGVRSNDIFITILQTPISFTQRMIGSVSGDQGDGKLAIEEFSLMQDPAGLAVDGQGNIYVADRGTHRIRKVDTQGFITTIAGLGVSGFSGDQGPAAQAALNAPRGIAVDGSGNIFIADTANHRVRRIDGLTGIISTVAGTGAPGFFGDQGIAIQARLNTPTGVSFDAFGNLFIADAANHRVRRVDTLGVINTIAGNGVAGFGGDQGPATQASLNFPDKVKVRGVEVFIADTQNNRVRRIDANGVIQTIAGNGVAGFSGDFGPANIAQLRQPSDIDFDTRGGLMICDRGNHRLRRVDANGKINTVAGNGAVLGVETEGDAAVHSLLGFPKGMATLANGKILFSQGLLGNPGVATVRALNPLIPIISQAKICQVSGSQYTICMEGKFFGNLQSEGNAVLLVNGVSVSPSSWRNDQVIFTVNAPSRPVGTVELVVGGYLSNRRRF